MNRDAHVAAQTHEQLVRQEAVRAVEKAHEWLERVEEYRTPMGGYIGLDHRLGQNVEGCTYCHAAAVLYGLEEPILDE